MAQFFGRSSFADFSEQVNGLWESELGQNLIDQQKVRSSSDGLQIASALDQLVDVLADLQSIHGTQGPSATWNTFHTRGAAFQTNSRPSTPRRAPTTNWNLPNGAPTPPLTPMGGQNIAEIKTKLDDLTEVLKDRNTELERARNDIIYANRSLEEAKRQLAVEYESNKKYLLAAQEYESLSDLKASEKRRLYIQNKRDDAKDAENDQLKYKHSQGKMLVSARQYPQAEVAIQFVLERWKPQRNDDDNDGSKRRELQLELCRILRLQKTESKIIKAENLYRQASSLSRLESLNEADKSWVLLNAFYLVFTLAERALYGDATHQLATTWRERQYGSRKTIQLMEDETIKFIQLLESQHQPNHLKEVLSIYCDEDTKVTRQNWHYFLDLGIMFHDSGDHHRAVSCFQRARTGPSLSQSNQDEIRWLLAQSLCHVKDFIAADRVIADLLDDTPSGDKLRKLQYKALLAYTQLHLGELQGAATNADKVYVRHKTEDIIYCPAFHHANTLIYALAKQDERGEHFFKARDIWETIYSQRNLIAQKPGGKTQLKHHAIAGKHLGSDWEVSARERKMKPTSALKVKAQADELKRLAI